MKSQRLSHPASHWTAVSSPTARPLVLQLLQRFRTVVARGRRRQRRMPSSPSPGGPWRRARIPRSAADRAPASRARSRRAAPGRTASPPRRRQLVFHDRDLQLVLRIVRSAPTPASRPSTARAPLPSVRGRTETVRPTRRSSAANSAGNSWRIVRASGCHTSSARGSSWTAAMRRRKQPDDRQRPRRAMRSLAARPQLANDLRPRPRRSAAPATISGGESRTNRTQYFRTVWICSPGQARRARSAPPARSGTRARARRRPAA